MPFDRRTFEEHLQVLVGEPPTDIWSPIDFIFEFGQQTPGVNKRGDAVTYGKYSLSLASAWQVTQGATVILGSADYERRLAFLYRKTPPRDAKLRDRWKRAKEFESKVEKASLIVESVDVLPGPKLEVRLSEAFKIASIITHADSFIAPWRLRNRATGASINTDSQNIWVCQ